MTKLAFKAQVIFETDEWVGFSELGSPDERVDKRLEITFVKIKRAINEGKIDIEMIGSELSCDPIPVLIIKYKIK